MSSTGLTSPTRSTVRAVIGLLLLLTLLRVPYFITHHVQEDAYIHFQHAESLAATGVFGFNPGERVSGSTSPLYVVLITPLFGLMGDNAIPVVLVINCLIFNAAALLIASAVYPNGSFRRRAILAAFISLSPTGLVASYSGMESSLLIFLFAVLIYGYDHPPAARFSLIALVLLPWTRLDSLSFVGLYLLAVLIKNWRRALLEGVVVGASLAAMLVIFKLYFGEFLPQTILAKAVAYNIEGATPLFRVTNTLEALSRVLMPINSKYLYGIPLELLWTGALVVVIALAVRRYWRTPQRNLVLLLSAYSLLLPIGYGLSGANLFPWYLFPPTLFVLVLLGRLLIEWIAPSRRVYLWSGVVAALLIVTAGMQWALALSSGTQDYNYRRSIGLWIHDHSQPGDSLMLEPVGYIGHFSSLYIHDEVGLISPLMTQYRETHGLHWWWDYIREKQPTFIIERRQIWDQRTFFSPIPPQDYQAFQQTYTLVKSFHYHADDYFSNPVLLRIADLGQAADYYVFESNDAIKRTGG